MRDSAYNKIDHTYHVYEALKCRDHLRARTDEKIDPNCDDTKPPPGEDESTVKW